MQQHPKLLNSNSLKKKVIKDEDLISAIDGQQNYPLFNEKIIEFFDKTLSNPQVLSCASCHSPAQSFSDPKGSVFSEGAVKGLFGTRNAPALSYNVFSPKMYYDIDNETYVGGFFWDGRSNTLE